MGRRMGPSRGSTFLMIFSIDMRLLGEIPPPNDSRVRISNPWRLQLLGFSPDARARRDRSDRYV